MSFIDTDDPFSIAAKRIRSSVIRSTPEPQLPIQGKQQPTTYIIEPDLMESQTGKMNLPNDVAFDDAGFAYNTVTGNPVQVVRRPNVLPIARTPEGFTFAMPKILDAASNIVGGVAAPAVATKAGEVVLGSGAVRKTAEVATDVPWEVKGFENSNWYHGTTHDFDKFKLAKGNPENHLGKYPHFTTSPEDAAANYAGKGPDLTARIERRAEELFDRARDKYPNGEVGDDYGKVMTKAKQQATKELAGPHEGAIIPAKMKLENPVSLVDSKPTWLDFNAKYDKNGEWIKESPNTIKLLNSLKKQGEKYGFDGQKVFDDISEKAGLYEGEVTAATLDKAMRESEYMLDAYDTKGAMISSHVISDVFKALGFDGIVMDAHLAFPNMKNIPEGTLHAVPLKRNTVKGKYNDQILYSDTRNQVYSEAGRQLEKAAQGPFYSALERTVDNAKIGKADANQWLGYLKNQPGVKQEELSWVLNNLPEGQISKEALSDIIKNNKIELKEVVKGELKPQPSKYNIPEVRRAVAQSGDTPGDLEMILANDGNAYRALMRRFPELNDNEDWAQIVAKSVYGGDSRPVNTAKYHDYQLPGGENYQEMLLTLPDKQKRLYEWEYFDPKTQTSKQFKTEAEAKAAAPEGAIVGPKETQTLNESYKSSHWDEPNILAHVRYNDRNIPDVGKSLHLEEIQSDWHQAGRKQGYLQKYSPDELTPLPKDDFAYRESPNIIQVKAPDNIYEIAKSDRPDRKIETFEDAKNYILQNKNKGTGSIPDAPFKKNWDELAFKRMLHKAANEGYDSVSWTPGEAQAARYDLSKQLKELQYLKNDDGTYQIAGITAKGDGFNHPENVTAAKLPDVVGKDMAEKIINNEGKRARGHSANGGYFEGVDLKVGGEGMKYFYDKMLVDKANALAKKYGAKVETKNVNNDNLMVMQLGGDEPYHVYTHTQNGIKPVSKFKTDKEAQDFINKNQQPVHVLKLTPELRAKAKEGFPLFSSTPITTPVDYDPWKDDVRRSYTLVPVSHDPFK